MSDSHSLNHVQNWEHRARGRILRCPLDAYSPRITLFRFFRSTGDSVQRTLSKRQTCKDPIVHWIHINGCQFSTVPRNRICIMSALRSTLYIRSHPFYSSRKMHHHRPVTDHQFSAGDLCLCHLCHVSIHQQGCLNGYVSDGCVVLFRMVNVSDSSHAISLPVLCTAYIHSTQLRTWCKELKRPGQTSC